MPIIHLIPLVIGANITQVIDERQVNLTLLTSASSQLTPPHPIPDNSPNYNHSQPKMIIEETNKEDRLWRTRILP